MKRRVYEGRFTRRVRLYVRLDPETYELLRKIAEKWFPQRKKRISITIERMIREIAERELAAKK